MQQQCLENKLNQFIHQPPQGFDVYHNLISQDGPEAQKALQTLQSTLPNIKLSNIQLIVFCQSWQGKTYGQIANSTSYDPDYLKDVGHKLWKELSIALEQPISKHNFSSVLRQRVLAPPHQSETPSQAFQPYSSQTELSNSASTAKRGLYWDEVPEVPIFMGRTHELGQLKQWIVLEHNRLIGLFGLGGTGKTTLAAKCVGQVQGQFDYVIWRSLRNYPDYDSFITGLLQCLVDQNAADDLPKTPAEKTSLLIQCLNQHRCLLVIDDWFTVLSGHTRAGLHQEKHDHYGLLLRRVSEGRHQSCVLITSREKPVGLAFKDSQELPVKTLHINGLDREAGRAALKAFGLSETNAHLDRLLEYYSGNPYALRVATKTIIDLFNGQTSKFLELEQLIYGDIHHLLKQQYHRLTKTEEHLMHCLANLPGWASLSDIEQNMPEASHNRSLLETIESLDHRSFIEKQAGKFRLPRLLQEFANIAA